MLDLLITGRDRSWIAPVTDWVIDAAPDGVHHQLHVQRPTPHTYYLTDAELSQAKLTPITYHDDGVPCLLQVRVVPVSEQFTRRRQEIQELLALTPDDPELQQELATL